MIEAALKDILEKTFDGGIVYVENQSHLHHGHAGSPHSGQSHFFVKIVSEEFEGLTRVQRHQKINDVIKPLFDKGLHALSLDLKTPSKNNPKL